MTNRPTPPDTWHKLEARIPILNSLAQFVLVTLLGFFAKCSVDDYTHNMERTKRVDELTTSLSTLDTDKDITKRNLALVTLDRLYSHPPTHWWTFSAGTGENVADDSLMFNIAEEVYRAQMATPVKNGDTAQVLARLNLAARIMSRRHTTRAQALVSSFKAAARDKTRSSPDANASVTFSAVLASRPIAPANKALLNATIPGDALSKDAAPTTCYIQFRELTRPAAQQLQKAFQQQGWLAPGVERVPGTYGCSVRYYFPDDEATARKVLAQTQDFMSRQKEAPPVALVSLADKNLAGKVPHGQIEIWLSFGAAPKE